jgi:thymidylate synthase
VSCDTFLGVPFNWVGQAALQLMLADLTGLIPGEMVWTGADVHLYSNTWEASSNLLTRTIKPSSTMKIINHRTNIIDYTIDDFELVGYDPHPPIGAAVAV